MNNEIYDNPGTIYDLIAEMNRITNEEVDYEEIKGNAPYIYTHGKCYYFARGLHEVIPDSTLYSTLDGGHIVIKVGEYFYDAAGIIWEKEEMDKIDPRPFDLNNDMDIFSLHTLVANDYDDEHLLPVVISIAKKADKNIKERLLEENITKKR